jgi:hypothetical protein
LIKQWTPESLRVFVQSVLAKSVVQLRLLRRRRKRDNFGDCHAWTRMLALLLLFVKKYQQRSLLRLIPMVVCLLKPTPMGVIVHQLIPMGVTLLKLTNGCDRVEAEPNGCDRASAIVCIFYEDEEEEEEVPLIRKNSRCYRGSRGDSDIPSPALSALVSLQELSITEFDQALEDVIP